MPSWTGRLQGVLVIDESKSSSANLMPTFLGVALVLLVVATTLIAGLARRPSGGLSLPSGYHVVHLSEYSYGFRLASTTLPRGNIVFVDKNTGTIPHEFVLFKTDLRAASLPLKPDGTVEEDSPSVEDYTDSGSALAPGETRLMTADLDPGHYVLVCNLPPSHYTSGMRVDITVK